MSDEKKSILRQDHLYQYIKSFLMPVEMEILTAFDEIYNVSDEDKLADSNVIYMLSDFLSFAADICFEVESRRNDES